jgi:hypothetical protein
LTHIRKRVLQLMPTICWECCERKFEAEVSLQDCII